MGLMGDGEIGVRGRGPGDLRDKAGREGFCAAAMLTVSLGLTAARGSMMRRMVLRLSKTEPEDIKVWGRMMNKK